MYLDPNDNDPHPAPPLLPTILPELPKTQAEAKKYLKLANTPGVWNNNTSGRWTVWEYLQFLLSIEFRGVSSEELAAMTVRDFYARCGNYCDIHNPVDILRYIALKGLNASPRDVNPSNAQSEIDSGLNSTNFFSAFLNPQEDWKTGCGKGNVPCTWGNKSIADDCARLGTCTWAGSDVDWGKASANIVSAANVYKGEGSIEMGQLYYLYDPNGNFFFILTANQAYWIYH
jgi:hypothetical protein